MSKRCQARVTQACVESALLFDCQVRTWQNGEIKKLQSFVDRMYRYIWSNKTKPPLIQMQEDGKNMQDIRTELGIKSIRWKIEKRCLERIGHIMRMEDNRIVKAVTLGWMESLESAEKVPGKKRKTMLYYKKLVKEAGMDYTRIGQMTGQRKEWRKRVNKRMKHLDKWEKQRGKLNREEKIERNNKVPVITNFTCDFEGCNKVCKDKTGLAVHRKRMHEASSHKVIFYCDKCNMSFKTESNKKNHQKVCGGLAADRPDQRKCNKCNKSISVSNIARHIKKCTVTIEAGQPQPDRTATAARVYRPNYKTCENCNRLLSSTNMARHQKKCQPREEA